MKELSEIFPNLADKAPIPSEEMERYNWTNEIAPRLKASGFDVRFWNNIQNWNCDQQEHAHAECERRCQKNGAVVVLTGARGTGKTTICAQMAIARARNPALPPWERQPPYRKACDLIARYKPLYADFGSTEIDTLMSSRDALCRNALLFIDELHECDDQKMKDRLLTDIIDRRYAKLKDTILISNQSVSDFKNITSDSILSRIAEHGVIIPCEWSSWRRQP